MQVVKNLTGLRFGRIEVVAQAGRNKWRYVMWRCHCDCGTQWFVSSNALLMGRTSSCGKCRPTNFKHGRSRTRTYFTWRDIRNRCYDRNNRFYHLYGGRGIAVCSRWRESFENFLADMGEKPVGLTIERINNDADYQPDNCCWATRARQAQNTRRTIFLTHNNETLCLSEWARRLGVSTRTIPDRIRRGWDVARAISTPAKARGE